MVVAEYTSDLATGGDSLTEDLNIYYEVGPQHHIRPPSPLHPD